ncbi:GmrSD restriction endonuclease domain-containing protein [Rothia nasimurium]|uniref:GmrSD restriction endonuclease domain-containing protein n=1 Tax=Rothia nasimurium TaxID=85336 RepID=UPI003BA1DA71
MAAPAQKPAPRTALWGCLGCLGIGLVIFLLVSMLGALVSLLSGGSTSATSSESPIAPPSHSVSVTPSPAAPAPSSSEPAPDPTSDTPAEEEAAEEDQAFEVAPVEGAVEEFTATSAHASIDLLNTLEVKGRAPKTGYARTNFGDRWADVDRNGCDTRNDILRRDLIDIQAKGRGCVILTGTLNDPYTGKVIAFHRGQDTSDTVQIDHVVALSDAWQKGAQGLSFEQRTAFANDPLNLLAVDGPTNQQKGDSDAASWLPPAKEFRCNYVARQIDVKAKYGLWVTEAEKQAMVTVLSSPGCAAAPAEVMPPAEQMAPAEEMHPAEQVAPVAPAEPAPVQQFVAPPPPAVEAPVENLVFKNCSEARAAGYVNIPVGHPAYQAKMDGDGDGIACESK